MLAEEGLVNVEWVPISKEEEERARECHLKRGYATHFMKVSALDGTWSEMVNLPYDILRLFNPKSAPSEGLLPVFLAQKLYTWRGGFWKPGNEDLTVLVDSDSFVPRTLEGAALIMLAVT